MIDPVVTFSDEELEAFIVKIVRANNRGVSAIRNVTNEPNWSFGQAFFFAGTVLTTIGVLRHISREKYNTYDCGLG